MKEKLLNLLKKISVLKGIILFLFLLTLSWSIWHFSSHFFARDKVLKPFYYSLISSQVFFLTNYFSANQISFQKIEYNKIQFASKYTIRITDECSGLQHIFEIIFILTFYVGSWRKKIWYIPLSILIIYFASLLHLLILSFSLLISPKSFIFMHDQVSRWIFFSFFLFIWIFWEEKFAKFGKK